MRRTIVSGLMAVSLLLLGAGTAAAWHLEGRVLCDGIGTPLAGVEILVEQNDAGNSFWITAVTDLDGHYVVQLADEPRCYRATIVLGPTETAVDPASGVYEFCTTAEQSEVTKDWVVGSPTCSPEHCWLTGGGAKYSPITGTQLGVAKVSNNKLNNFGGNVNPGCNTESGEGGQWNNIADDLRLHFQGFAIQVVRCGNVDGIEPGSESPVTPYNFIEFEGTGRVQGIKGNKDRYDLVYFFARCEDRNEPGSNGQRDGALKDRYFLNVFTEAGNPTGSSLILVDIDGNPATVDPLVITDGNLQIHVSSCDGPDLVELSTGAGVTPALMAPAAPAAGGAPWFAAPRPSPAGTNTTLRFSVPRESDVSLAVYDLMGREIRVLADGRAAAGLHAFTWDLRDADGRPVGRGMYFLRLRVDGAVLSQRVSVVR